MNRYLPLEDHHPRVTGRPQINWSFFEGKMNTFRGPTSRDFYAGYKGIQGMPTIFYLEGQYLRTSSYSARRARVAFIFDGWHDYFEDEVGGEDILFQVLTSLILDDRLDENDFFF